MLCEALVGCAQYLQILQDDDGSAYLAYASKDNHIMHIAPLTEDYLDVKATYKRILIGLKREAPTLFKFKDHYLLLTSGCTGWEPNAAEMFYSRYEIGCTVAALITVLLLR